MSQPTSALRIAATYMRGGTSKGLFFLLQDLPAAAQTAGPARDQLLARAIGSPDPYGKHIDGMGGASSSTSKVVIVSRSHDHQHDVDYLFGQVAVNSGIIDWSGNCGNLTAAVGVFAIERGLVVVEPDFTGQVTVRIWQVNVQQTLLVTVPVEAGAALTEGNFKLDGVAFPAAELGVTFVAPHGNSPLLPTGHAQETLSVPGLGVGIGEGTVPVTLVRAGIASVLVAANAVGLSGAETQADINNDSALLKQLESIRLAAAARMGLAPQPHTPKLVLVAAPQSYRSADGRDIRADECHLLVRAISMGQAHHALMGTAAVALASAAAVPDSVVSELLPLAAGQLEAGATLVCGHASGLMPITARARHTSAGWQVEAVTLQRSARIIMEGWVRIPALPHG